MTIQTFSPLKGGGTYYLNKEDFEGRLMFTDINPSLNYLVIRWDVTDSVWKVISNGKLNGYNDNSVYQYKFDLDTYIKIEHYKSIELQNIETNIQSIQYIELPKYMSKVSLAISETNIFNSNSGYFTYKPNGEIWLSGSYTPYDLNDATNYDYTFYDKKTNDSNVLPLNLSIYRDTWIPITTYSASEYTYVKVRDLNNDIILDRQFSSSTDGVPKLFMIYIPILANTIEISTTKSIIEGINLNYQLSSRCVTPYYFWGVDGNLEILYADGNSHEVDTVTKSYITVNDKKLTTDISTSKQLKVNTGFNLKQEQIYSLLKSPYMFTMTGGDLGSLDRNYILNSLQISTSGTPLPLSIANSTYLLNDTEYIFSVNSSTKLSGSATSYTVEVVDTGSSTILLSKTLLINSTLQYFSISVPETGNYSILVYPGLKGGSVSNIKLNKVKLELATGIYLIYERLVGIFFKLEKDGIPTYWVSAIEDSGSDRVKLKDWLLDTNTFEGYIGSNYSEKNIELLLTDSKTYKRKTNIDLTFWE